MIFFFFYFFCGDVRVCAELFGLSFSTVPTSFEVYASLHFLRLFSLSIPLLFFLCFLLGDGWIAGFSVSGFSFVVAVVVVLTDAAGGVDDSVVVVVVVPLLMFFYSW